MAIVAVFEFPNDPVEKSDKVFEAGGSAITDQPQRISHVCYRTEHGFTVVDVWTDEAAFAAFGQVIGPATVAAGLDVKPQVYPVQGLISQDGRRPHSFAVDSDGARALILCWPVGGLERAFAELATPVGEPMLPPLPAGPPTDEQIQHLVATFARHDIEFLPRPEQSDGHGTGHGSGTEHGVGTAIYRLGTETVAIAAIIPSITGHNLLISRRTRPTERDS